MKSDTPLAFGSQHVVDLAVGNDGHPHPTESGDRGQIESALWFLQSSEGAQFQHLLGILRQGNSTSKTTVGENYACQKEPSPPSHQSLLLRGKRVLIGIKLR